MSNPPEAVVATSLEERGQRFVHLLKKAQTEPSEKLIHDLRVATRRLLATLDVVATMTSHEHAAGIRKTLRRWLKASSPLRDLQVQILSTRELLSRHPILEPFLTILLLREKTVIKRIIRTLKKGKVAGMERRVDAVCGQLRMLCDHPASRRAVEAAASGAAGVAFVRAAERFLLINSNDTVTIHQFRLSFKRLRYTLEALHPLLPSIAEGHLKAMNEYQQKMGDIQDLEVLRSTIDAYAGKRGMTEDRGIAGVRNELLSRRAALVDRFMIVAGDFYRFWPSEFQEVPVHSPILRLTGVR